MIRALALCLLLSGCVALYDEFGRRAEEGVMLRVSFPFPLLDTLEKWVG